jgi:hypothetical protein
MTLRAAPKPQPPLVSPLLRKSARGKPCSVRWDGCDGGGETTVLAHLRQWSDAGVAQKPDDTFAVYACFNCHNAIDRRRMDNDNPVPAGNILRALYRTQQSMLREGLLKVGRPR